MALRGLRPSAVDLQVLGSRRYRTTTQPLECHSQGRRGERETFEQLSKEKCMILRVDGEQG